MATAKAPLATRIRELLSEATAEDVKVIDEQIAAKQAEIETLKSDRKLLADAAGTPEGVVRIPASDIPARRKKVLAYLKANGPKSSVALAEQTGINRQGPGNLASVLAYEWFHVSPEGMVTLTDKGDRAIV